MIYVNMVYNIIVPHYRVSQNTYGSLGNLTEIITEDNNQSNFRVAELSPTFYINNTIPDQRS